MGVELLTDRYSKQIAGILSCYDRILIFGTLPKICYAEGMTSWLYQSQVRIFDYPKFAEPFRDAIRQNAEKLAADQGIEIEYIRKKNFRKEDRIKEVLSQRGGKPGLVWIFSAMQPCATFKPWHDKFSGKTFLGRKLYGNYQDEMGNRFNIRIEGTRIKHTMGPVSIKMYDKFSLILRIETTVNDLSFFKHYREVEHRDGKRETKWAPMQKTIYSLPALRELLAAANRRYLEFLSTIEDPRAGNDKLNKLSQPVEENDRSFPGFNFFDPDDQLLFETIARGEYNISGFQNKSLRLHLTAQTTSQMSRTFKRLRLHGLIKKIGRTYKYYLTSFGKHVIATGFKLKHLVIIPGLAFSSPA